MTPENTSIPSSERLLLASIVNKFCSTEMRDDFDLGSLLDDARKIVNKFDPILRLSDKWYFGSSSRGRSSSFGGLASTGNGQFQTSLEDGERKKDIQFGRSYEDRIGLYKVTKSDEDNNNFALNFNYFMEQVSRDEDVVGIGPLTHILYDKDNHSIKAVLKSTPMLFKFLNIKIVWFKQSVLWGKGKLNSLTIQGFR